MVKYKQHTALKDGYCAWEKPIMKGYKLACCDCGLVHIVDFRVVKVVTRHRDGSMIFEPAGKRYEVEFRVARDNRATGQIRRHRKA
jgi:hypothetical protein